MKRAYAKLEVRSISETSGKRILAGIATTPETDSYGDIVESEGADYDLPLPLLWQHDSSDPIGWVRVAKSSKKGIEVEVEVARASEPGPLQERLDMAWQYIKDKLVRGLSIGFQPLESARIEGTYGYRYTKWKWLELSAVTIPANADASITAIRSADAAMRAPSGRGAATGARPPALSGNSSALSGQRGNATMKSLDQLIEERTNAQARATELRGVLTSENRKFSPEEATEFDSLTETIGELDHEIRLKRFDERMASNATAVSRSDPDAQRASRGGISFVRKQDPDDQFPGQSFTRLIIARALGRVYGESPSAIAEHRYGKTHPKLVQFIRAAVAGGGSGSGEWGAELVAMDGRFTGDFITFLYGLTLFDGLNLTPVPQNVTVKGQDGAMTANWVGESKAIPMSKPDFSTVNLTPLKVAAITTLSNELIADSQPAAERLVRDSLANASAQKVDSTFLGAAAASAGVSPAGILNGVTAIQASAATADGFRSDVTALLKIFGDANASRGLSLLMQPNQAMALSMLVNSLGQDEFPGITMNGGTFKGLPILVGNNVTAGNIIALRAEDVWKIGDSGIQVSMSDVATIEQNDAPAGASDTPVAMASHFVSMFQSESTAFKVVRRINFQKRRTFAAQYIDNAEYGGVVS